MTERTKVLVVYGDPALLWFIRKNLSENGYEISNARSSGHFGVELEEELEEKNPDLIILDIMMPSLDGVGICLNIRQFSKAPIIMLSTWKANEDKIRGLNLNSNNYLTEPFGAEELMAKINKLFQRNLATASAA